MKSQELDEAVVASPSRQRKRAPVFVIGCGRSGTTLLYHMILSAGNFAVYRTESNAINLLEPRFGDLSKEGNKRRLLEAWYDSRLYTLSGLDREKIGKKVMDEVHNGGEFLRVVMEEICRQQGVERWAECTPEHLLHLDRIKQTIPDALIVHIIRDGRDSSLSMEKGHWIRPFPWQKKSSLNISGLYWEWMVNKGQQDGRRLGSDYTEVRFEELVTNPRETLAKLGEFIDHDLDYDRIREVGIGSVSEPNSSFKPATSEEKFNPVGRWKQKLSPAELRTFEGLVGRTLTALGYTLATTDWSTFEQSKLNAVRTGYRAVFDSKLWLKAKTPLGPLFTTRKLDWI
jgi:Sulfotransferase family